MLVALGPVTMAVRGQMVVGEKMPGYAEAFGLISSAGSPDFAVQELGVTTPSSTMVNVVTTGESARFLFQITNKTHAPIKGTATLELIRYGTSVPEGDVWVPHVFKIADAGKTPVTIDVDGGKTQQVNILPAIPSIYGGYAMVLEIEGHGRSFAGTLVRVVTPDAGRVQFPTYALDTEWPSNMNEGVYSLFQKLGIKGVRLGAGFNSVVDKRAYDAEQAQLDKSMSWASKHEVTVMMTLGAGAAESAIQPLGRPRPWLDPNGTMLKTKDDRAWLPSADGEFQDWVTRLASTYGWPKGNLNAMELWNEPWDGISISGWGADIPRYREIYTHMAQGVVAAREQAGVKVLIGGTSSSSNARDKLFPDGKDTFLKWFDFVSIHYQALAADPSEVPEWIHREGPYGPTRVWDTESWIANSDDRIAGVIASMRAQGQSRTAGVYRGNVFDSRNLRIGGDLYPVVQAWSPAAAIAASQKFIGQRDFNRILFTNGLPWVFVFDGLAGPNGAAKADDGTLVVVGDLAKIYPPNRTLFHSVSVAPDAAMLLSDGGGEVRLFDFYGNPVASTNGRIRVPLNGLGYFLRTDGSAGSFEKLVAAVRVARIAGVAPVEIVAHDLTAPVEQHPLLRLSLTNVLNRAVTGTLSATLGGLSVSAVPGPITLQGNESRNFDMTVSGTPAAINLYPLMARFDGGADGSATHEEEMHANVIAKRTIKVDGDLDDWQGVLPQILPGSALKANLTEEAYLPFLQSGSDAAGGMATAYMAYDNDNFYFAAKIGDATPDPGQVRFETRDDDSYFYPATVTTADGQQLSWPTGVRRYSYRRKFDTPAGASLHDNVQIAFNVVAEKPWLPYPRGTMPRFISYWDTDYEYALNSVAPAYGGGVEIWRLLAPGVPVKEDFPREPKAERDQGPVKNGRLVMKRIGNTRIVEAAIPWSEIPAVHARILAGKTIKFSCRVNDNQSASRELATGRSVSKENGPAFHDSWQTHWANELEFGFEK
jgi:hypothetical protein